jgi:hypothetical protein
MSLMEKQIDDKLTPKNTTPITKNATRRVENIRLIQEYTSQVVLKVRVDAAKVQNFFILKV